MPDQVSPTPTWRARLAGLPPWAKLAVWAALVVILGLATQALALLVGLEFDITARSGGGRALVMVYAVGTLLVLMAADRRPAADYGLVVGAAWPAQLLGSLAIGMATYAAYCAATVGIGTLELSFRAATPYRWASGLMAGMTSLPLALAQQVIFSGYLLSIFRQRHSVPVAIGLVSLLFSASFLVDDSAAITGENLRLAAGMMTTSVLVCLVRLTTGTILVPSGLLAGWMLVRRVVRRTDLLIVADPHAANWWAPTGDPRQSPVLWLTLIAAAGYFAWRLKRDGEPKPAAAAIDSSFKRVAPFSNACMLAPLDLWVGRLWQARLDVGPQYLPRLAAILAFSTLNTLLSLPERLISPWLARCRRLRPPVFILGVHRSGTTHLHNLLALDPQFVTPRAYQIMNPVGFLFSGWLLAPLLGAFSPWKRPMDSVRFHLFAPNEDEFALTGVTHLSPYWGLTFPRQWPHYDRFVFPDEMDPGEVRAWRRHYATFLGKLVFWSGKTALLKNPYNTARVALLAEMFPGARFIHICRHPEAVYRSNLHMAREGHCIYQLQDPDEKSSYGARFLENFRRLEEAYCRDAALLGPGQRSEVRFEDLERDPIAQIERIYGELGLTISPTFRTRLAGYLADVADYEKNRFRPAPDEERYRLYRALAPLYERGGYEPPPAARERAA